MADVSAVTTFYGRIARVYDLVATHTPGIPALRRRAVEALALSPGDTVVEMGCGTGANLPYLRQAVGPDGRVVGIDLTPGMLRRARQRVDRHGWRNVHVARADADAAPFQAVDGVLATFVVGMLADPGAAIDRWVSLVPEGRIALVDATRSESPTARPLNGVFRAFVTLTTPPAGRLRYDVSPTMVLDDRVTGARNSLATTGEITVDDRLAFGFIRLTAARIGSAPRA
ncbi:MAG: methyltransferase domain-containing protein [Halobacteriales archaeon]|nr:methyltransferase domain-containing protein [Halobacteriales archaeon]